MPLVFLTAFQIFRSSLEEQLTPATSVLVDEQISATCFRIGFKKVELPKSQSAELLGFLRFSKAGNISFTDVDVDAGQA